MRKLRFDDFDPKPRKRKPDVVNLEGIVPLESKNRVSQTESSVLQDLDNSVIASSNKDEKASVVSRYHGSIALSHDDPALISRDEAGMIQQVRKAVKEFGKEAATHRFTQAEKKAIAQIVFAYRDQGIRTSENEIARIAMNFLFYDYEHNGEKSILHKSLISLNE